MMISIIINPPSPKKKKKKLGPPSLLSEKQSVPNPDTILVLGRHTLHVIQILYFRGLQLLFDLCLQKKHRFFFFVFLVVKKLLSDFDSLSKRTELFFFPLNLQMEQLVVCR